MLKRTKPTSSKTVRRGVEHGSHLWVMRSGSARVAGGQFGPPSLSLEQPFDHFAYGTPTASLGPAARRPGLLGTHPPRSRPARGARRIGRSGRSSPTAHTCSAHNPVAASTSAAPGACRRILEVPDGCPVQRRGASTAEDRRPETMADRLPASCHNFNPDPSRTWNRSNSLPSSAYTTLPSVSTPSTSSRSSSIAAAK